MSWLLPYLAITLLLLAVMAKWALQILRQRSQAQVVLVERVKSTSGRRNSQPRRELAERIFDPRDWEFVSHCTSPEIQKAFQRERALLAIAWLQRAKSQASSAMRQHAKATGRSENLELYTEGKIVLVFVLFFVLCNGLIALIWFRGAFATQRMVAHALHLNVRLRSSFEDLMLAVNPANQIYSGSNFGGRTI